MTSVSLQTKATGPSETEQNLIVGKRRRKIREALTGYVFLLPATVATFLFGLWPVVAGFYESLKSGSPITNKYVGMGNYLRQLGSLTYTTIFALCLIFLYLGYKAWRGAYAMQQERGGALGMFIVPGFVLATGVIALGFTFVTGVKGYSWFAVVTILLAFGGFFTADHFQPGRDDPDARGLVTLWAVLVGVGAVWIGGPRVIDATGLGTVGWVVLIIVLVGLLYSGLPSFSHMKTGHYASSIAMMSLFMLAALLLGRYAISQMEGDVTEAQNISKAIFNQSVLDGVVDVTDDNARIAGLTFAEGEVIVEVKVNNETVRAPLAPEAYSELPVDKIARLEAAFANNQKIRVVMPDGSVAEGQLTGVAQGEKLYVGFTADNAQSVRQIDIYSALNVGEAVVQNGGHTEPLSKQVNAALGVFIGLCTIYFMTWVRRRIDDEENYVAYRWLYFGRIAMIVVVLLMLYYLVGAMQLSQQAAAGMGALSQDQFARAYQFAIGQAPPAIMRPEVLQARLLYWPQIFMISIGALLIGAAYLVWQSAQKRETPLGFGLTILMAVSMMVGGWLLLSELPQTLKLGGREAEEAFAALKRTAMYSIGTVPIQLALGLVLAYLLFSEISWGKSIYRVIYFMPYIAPSVATSTVFLVIFRPFSSSLANRALGVFGIKPLTWLKEPNGIVRVFYEQVLGGNPLNIPIGLAGPSLALVTVILYNIWVFAGYNAVVFLAGLGAIPPELYEAAEVDGAGRWSRFRNITLPLLSPTTFFLSMLSVIGTFKAFTHIYVLRNQATGKEIDTMSVHIFNTLYSANDPGYAAALAFSLFGVILILTLVQNRLAREQVFYG